jgi:hypothetical protein
MTAEPPEAVSGICPALLKNARYAPIYPEFTRLVETEIREPPAANSEFRPASIVGSADQPSPEVFRVFTGLPYLRAQPVSCSDVRHQYCGSTDQHPSLQNAAT